jgi:hypothetical protein
MQVLSTDGEDVTDSIRTLQSLLRVGIEVGVIGSKQKPSRAGGP